MENEIIGDWRLEKRKPRSCKCCGTVEEWKAWPEQIGNMRGIIEVSTIGNICFYEDGPLLPQWTYNPKLIERKSGVQRLSYKVRKGETRTVSVSTMILETFVGPPPFAKNNVIRKDDNNKNNCLCNIQWR